MLKQYSRLFENLMLLGDLVAISAIWLFSYYLRFYGGPIPLYKSIPHLQPYLALLILIFPIWAVAFKAFGLYRPRRISSRLKEVWDIAKASTFSTLILVTVTFFLRQYEFSRMVFLFFWMFSILGLSLMRAAFREVLRFFRHRGYNLRYVVIVGAGRLAQEVAARLQGHPELGIRIVGLLAEGPGVAGEVGGIRILGNYQDLLRIVTEKRIDQVIIALPLDSSQRLGEILKHLGDEPVDIKVVPDLQQYVSLGGGIEEFEGLPFVSIQDSPLHGWNGVVKRAVDVVISLTALVVAAPLILLIAAAIKLTSPGPVFYRQERMGLDGRLFQMLKFRSMRVNAEREEGPVWTRRDDPRRTLFGAFLRRTSLDELPQLFNVLKGEMSLVGPRPERPVFIQEFRKTIPRYMLRHKIKAGITGWAQVNGWRGNTSPEKRIEHDLYYIGNWSLLFDLKILWLTVWKGLISKHAY